MPRYRYQCTACENEAKVFHLMDESYTDCVECGTIDSMKKMLTSPLKKVITEDASNNSQVGNITKEYIEANREILEVEKQSAKREFYEPS